MAFLNSAPQQYWFPLEKNVDGKLHYQTSPSLITKLPEAGSPMKSVTLRLKKEWRVVPSDCVCHVFGKMRCVSCCQPACQRQAAPIHNRGSSLQLGYIDDE